MESRATLSAPKSPVSYTHLDVYKRQEPSQPFTTPYAPQIATGLAVASLFVPTGRARFLLWLFGAIFAWRSLKEGIQPNANPSWKWGPRCSVLLLLGTLMLGIRDVWNQSTTDLVIHSDQVANFVLTADGVRLTPSEDRTGTSDPNTVKFEIPPGQSTHLSLKLPGYQMCIRDSYWVAISPKGCRGCAKLAMEP